MNSLDNTPNKIITSVPPVGFGTYLISDLDAAPTVAKAINLGYRHIDTAAGYNNEAGVGLGIKVGLSEAGIERSDIYVTTKLWPGYAAWGDTPKTSEQTIEAFEASRSKLGLDYIDLYLIHTPSGGTERLNQWRALVQIKADEKVRSIGVSNFTEAHINELQAAGLPMPDYNQIELHPWSQKEDLLSHMAEHGIKPIAYSSLVPLSTWRTEAGQDSSKTDAMKADGEEAVSPFKAMAAKYDVTEAQVLLRWCLQKGYPVLSKSLNPERMRENLDIFDFDIDDGDMALIDTMDRGDGVAWATGDPRFME